MWDLTLNELLWDLNEAGYYSIGFAGDIAIVIRDKFPSSVSEVLQIALKRPENWCNRTKFSFNPNKKNNSSIHQTKESFLFGSRIQLLTQVKYLGLILD
jgi:hypothetical protein